MRVELNYGIKQALHVSRNRKKENLLEIYKEINPAADFKDIINMDVSLLAQIILSNCLIGNILYRRCVMCPMYLLTVTVCRRIIFEMSISTKVQGAAFVTHFLSKVLLHMSRYSMEMFLLDIVR